MGNYFAAKSSTKLHEQLFLHNAIAEPNVQIDSQVTSNSSMFGGNIISNRSKNINGYIVPWNTLTSSYGWIRINIDSNELTPGFIGLGPIQSFMSMINKQRINLQHFIILLLRTILMMSKMN